MAMFIIARFFLGLGIPFAIVGASSLIGGGGLFKMEYLYVYRLIQSYLIQKSEPSLDPCSTLPGLLVSSFVGYPVRI